MLQDDVKNPVSSSETHAMVPVSALVRVERGTGSTDHDAAPIFTGFKQGFRNTTRYLGGKIDTLRKNINQLEKDLNTMGHGVARLRRKVKIYGSSERQ